MSPGGRARPAGSGVGPVTCSGGRSRPTEREARGLMFPGGRVRPPRSRVGFSCAGGRARPTGSTHRELLAKDDVEKADCSGGTQRPPRPLLYVAVPVLSFPPEHTPKSYTAHPAHS